MQAGVDFSFASFNLSHLPNNVRLEESTRIVGWIRIVVSPSNVIANFPLTWRWTSATHALFSEAELAGLQPCSAEEAAQIHNGSRSFDLRDRLDKSYFNDVRVLRADVSNNDVCSWLRTQFSNLNEPVTVSWDRETALRTSWEFFTEHWDDFCYPLSDDVLILPESGRWVLRYHHEEIFYFGERSA